jgi:hypothetical protein
MFSAVTKANILKQVKRYYSNADLVEVGVREKKDGTHFVNCEDPDWDDSELTDIATLDFVGNNYEVSENTVLDLYVYDQSGLLGNLYCNFCKGQPTVYYISVNEQSVK